jgi:hypothetical protein
LKRPGSGRGVFALAGGDHVVCRRAGGLQCAVRCGDADEHSFADDGIGEGHVMDIDLRDALLEKIGDVKNSPAFVTLEDFFTGNDDGASIWCNLPSEIQPQQVFAKLKTVRDRDDVDNVWILVTQFDGGQDEWPFSDKIFFVTSADAETVIGWLGPECAPDESWIGGPKEAEMLRVPAGMRTVVLWWD